MTEQALSAYISTDGGGKWTSGRWIFDEMEKSISAHCATNTQLEQ